MKAGPSWEQPEPTLKQQMTMPEQVAYVRGIYEFVVGVMQGEQSVILGAHHPLDPVADVVRIFLAGRGLDDVQPPFAFPYDAKPED